MPEIKIENKPELRSVARTALELSFTSLMWALWGYLFLPLLSAVLWLAGVRYVYQSIFEAAALAQLMEMLLQLGWALLIIFLVLRGWGYYNYFIFGRLDRRKHRVAVTPAEAGRHFGLSEEDVLTLMKQKEIVWAPLYDDLKQSTDRRKPRIVTHSGEIVRLEALEDEISDA